MTGKPRDTLRSTASMVAALAPQARYDRTILLLSHMRSASTALANVICSHPEVSGYGETHVPHNEATSPGRVVLNLAVRRAYAPRAPYIFDKILHTRLDADAPQEFFRSRAIFLLRQPHSAVRSILDLARMTGMKDCQSPLGAVAYYTDRLRRLDRLWNSFTPQNRIGILSEALLTDPDAEIARLGQWLSLDPMLANAYVSHDASQRRGGGDPVRSGRFTRIEVTDLPRNRGRIDGVDDVTWARCLETHATLLARFNHPGAGGEWRGA